MLEEFTDNELNIIKRCMEILLEDEWVYFSDMLCVLGVNPQKLREIVNIVPLLVRETKERRREIFDRLSWSYDTVVHNCLFHVYALTRLPKWVLGHYDVDPDEVISVRNKWRLIRNLQKTTSVDNRSYTERPVRKPRNEGANCWGTRGNPVGMQVFSEFSEDERTTLSRCIEIILEGEWISPEDMPTRLTVTQQDLGRILEAFPIFTNWKGREDEVQSSIILSADTIECVITNCLDIFSSITRMPRWILEDHYGLRPEQVRLVKRKWNILHGLP